MELSKRGKRTGRTASWQRQAVAAALALTLGLFCLPGIMSLAPLSGGDATQGEHQVTLGPIDRAEGAALPTAGKWDRGRTVRLCRTETGAVEEVSLEDYLWGVVAAEMPAAFQVEALKAQAVAARTYTVGKQMKQTSKHPDAQLCDDSSCCQAYIDRDKAAANWGDKDQEYAQKIQTAVAGTDGLGVTYEGELIQAVFFSSAAGKTVDAVAVWGNAVDYLVGVDSPEGAEVPNYHSQMTLSQEEVKAKILAAYPGADLAGGVDSWLRDPTYTASGSVATLTVGGVELSGGQVRGLFGLRSASFSYAWAAGQLTFQVTGYGHGVGMSQYGANAMAKEGKGFQEILTWYYSGTEVSALEGVSE